jgi:hypothetical protein
MGFGSTTVGLVVQKFLNIERDFVLGTRETLCVRPHILSTGGDALRTLFETLMLHMPIVVVNGVSTRVLLQCFSPPSVYCSDAFSPSLPIYSPFFLTLTFL